MSQQSSRPARHICLALWLWLTPLAVPQHRRPSCAPLSFRQDRTTCTLPQDDAHVRSQRTVCGAKQSATPPNNARPCPWPCPLVRQPNRSPNPRAATTCARNPPAARPFAPQIPPARLPRPQRAAFTPPVRRAPGGRGRPSCPPAASRSSPPRGAARDRRGTRPASPWRSAASSPCARRTCGARW